ncbi:uncharacterized protein LOC142983226 isoform X2 [Anticarsia gemmatalis]|uniref:uncharacterized protein LOC142983226 isoform X2 n=1 Tax=Anticarsia gemmatalis TaxID=129554 RepID=UPI003F7621A5
MNKKGKNKKGKVPNPTVVQEPEKIEDTGVEKENVVKTSEVVENVEEKVQSVKEERVPEIVSEVLKPPVDTKDEETPKKPKRNRGKKKKGKDDDFDDNLEEPAKETAPQPVVEEKKDDTLVVEAEPMDAAIVTATARKKKNKKKNAEQKGEEPTLSEPEMTTQAGDVIKEPAIVEESKQATIVQPEPTVLPEPIVPQEPVEPEVKQSKKKNKKKKRNDSEKSDKEEISCTSAFQKLIEAKEEPSEIKAEENIDISILPVEEVKAEIETKPEQILPQEEKATTPVVPSVEVETQQSPPEGKSKKKNKKDKKNIPKPEETGPVLDKPATDTPLPVEKDLPADTIIKEEIPIPAETLEKSEPIVGEASPKPKAKIAKPVEKKRKGKHDKGESENQATETPQETRAAEEIKPDAPSLITLESPAIPTEVPTTEIQPVSVETKIDAPIEVPVVPVATDEGKDLLDFESLNIPDKGTSKKKKKGLKVPKTPDVSFEVVEPRVEFDVNITETKPTEMKPIEVKSDEKMKEQPIVTEIVDVKEQPVIASSEMPAVEDEPISEPVVVAQMSINEPVVEPRAYTPVPEHILLTPEITEEKLDIQMECLIPEKSEDNLKFETKTNKKRKKSPKPPKKAETTPKPEETVKPVEEELPKTDNTKEMADKIDASNITKMYAIEISSIKADEPEACSSDPVPDITYPRASSQQLLDDNNNTTVIREIFPVQVVPPERKSQEKLKTPEPQNLERKEPSPAKEEKTDIKSKMMEVNQDMEELRLSIERSLAELTAMEKSEDVVEKQFEEALTKAEGNVPTAASDVIQKKDDQEKIMEISDAEKSKIEKPVEKSARIVQESKQIEELLLSFDIKPSPVKDTKPKPTVVEAKIDSKIVEKPKAVKELTPIVETKIEPLSMAAAEKVLDAAMTTETSKLTEQHIVKEPTPIPPAEEKKAEEVITEKKDEPKPKEVKEQEPPVCPARKDTATAPSRNKKKKGKQDSRTTAQATSSPQTSTSQSTQQSTQETKKDEKTDSKTDKKSDSKETKEKGKQQASNTDQVTEKDLFTDMDYEPIENFEDALTSSVDDVNKTFEMIVKESQEQTNPKINIIAPDEEKSHVSPPKNLLGHPDIPVQSSKRDYKKEKDKIPNEITAKVKIKDAVDVERKPSKNTQTMNKMKDLNLVLSDNEDFVYKYSFRKVFLQSCCQVCKKDVGGTRVACCYCNLVFYCGIKHKDEDWPQHQALCFAVSTLGHLKDQKHIYADAKNLTGYDYRLIRMQMIVSCEKILKRRLGPWEQEALLYPRICAHVPCREWRQQKLTDCQGCGQISFCTDNPDHLPNSHARWCKSYSLYQKLVCYQQTKGRLEPKIPTKVMQGQYQIPDKINEVLAAMYEEKIDMNDIQYAALTQIATAPLTTAYCYQMCRNKNGQTNGYKLV